MGGDGLEGVFSRVSQVGGIERGSKKAVSPTVLTALGMEQNGCFSAYLAFKTAFYSFSGSK